MTAAAEDIYSDRLLSEAAEQLRRAGIESPRREARLLLALALDTEPGNLIMRTLSVSPSQSQRFGNLVRRRSRREPFAHLRGSREFWSLTFHVSPDVLIPRPESETLIECALREFPDRDRTLRVLDLGTGTGCLLLTFLAERPAATGTGCDLSDAALSIAESNAKNLGLWARARFERSDWTAGISGKFDVIFANPPYIATPEVSALNPEVGQYEPRMALDGGADGLDAFRRIAAQLRRVAASDATLFAEIGPAQAGIVADLFSAQGWEHISTVPDLAGTPRCVVMRVNG